MGAPSESGFYVAPYGIDGEQAGLGFWEFSKLSGAWLGLCSEFLDVHGAVFDTTWNGTLNEVRTKFTSASGAAIGTLFVRERVASSFLLLSGRSLEVERSVTDMFVESLKRSSAVQRAAYSVEPFSTITAVMERPLMAVVAWADPTISDEEEDVIRELGVHLAGSFFSKESV